MNERPPIPQSRDELFIAAMRHANDVGGLLNELNRELMKLTDEDPDDPKFDGLHNLLLTRFNKHSAVHLFIAASNLHIELPPDLNGDSEEEDEK